MRASTMILFTALLGALSAVAVPPAPAPITDWQDAIQQLRGEREKAEGCLDQLRRHGDAYRIAQGGQYYAAAKAQMDQASKGLLGALQGKPAATDAGALEAYVDQAIEARRKLCRLLEGLVPDQGGEKGVLAQGMEPSFAPSKAAVRVLFAERGAEPLQRATVETQLTAARWSAAAPPPLANPTKEDDAVYPVWFGTNRRPDPDRSDRFTDQRNDRITYGRAEVFIPAAHRFGEIGTPFWKRLLRFDLRDDHLQLQQVSVQDPAAWLGELRKVMTDAAADGGQSNALVFLHGYNTSFEDAAIQAAQIGFDLKVSGATAFFSWPSKGSLSAYPADEAGIQASEAAITEFLVTFARESGADRVHLVAHSMGNRGLLRALQRIAGDAELRSKVKFGQIFLAAPDLDRDLFLHLAALYPQFSERTTLYESNGDLAVLSSSVLHQAPRAGYFKPYTVAPGIDTVAVPDFSIDVLGHGYFAQAEALLDDIHILMLHDEAPGRRIRIEPASEDGQHFWRMRR